jgi:hypothetical protein
MVISADAWQRLCGRLAVGPDSLRRLSPSPKSWRRHAEKWVQESLPSGPARCRLSGNLVTPPLGSRNSLSAPPFQSGVYGCHPRPLNGCVGRKRFWARRGVCGIVRKRTSLKVCTKTGLPGSEVDFLICGYDSKAVSDRLDRGRVAAPRPVPARAPLRRAQRRAPPGGGAARGPQRPVLPRPRRRQLAHAAPRLPALVHRLRLLPQVAQRRHLGARPRPAARGRAPGSGAAPHAQRRRLGQPDGEGDAAGPGPRLRRGEKKSPAASGTCWWTRWA